VLDSFGAAIDAFSHGRPNFRFFSPVDVKKADLDSISMSAFGQKPPFTGGETGDGQSNSKADSRPPANSLPLRCRPAPTTSAIDGVEPVE